MRLDQKHVTIVILLITLIEKCLPLSVGTVSVENADVVEVKRNGNRNILPDWVPFKNKHGAELGEFESIAKSKPKKRLALPLNFAFVRPPRAAKAGSDDYYDKSADSEDYYEKKEWSDATRQEIPANRESPLKNNIKPKQRKKEYKKNNMKDDTKDNLKDELDVSDIESVINIINEEQPNPYLKKPSKNEEPKKIKQKIKRKNKQLVDFKENQDEDYNDYEVIKKNPKPPPTEQAKTDEELRKESEKKAKIFREVDALKAKHAKEQKQLTSELSNEDAYFEEEYEREHQFITQKTPYLFSHPKAKKLTIEDSDEENLYIGKYEPQNIKQQKALKRKKTTARQILDDDEVVSSTPKQARKKIPIVRDKEEYEYIDVGNKIKDFKTTTSSEKSTEDKDAEDERIILVPAKESQDGEPTLFFVKKKKLNKLGKEIAKSQDVTGSSGADALEQILSKLYHTTPSNKNVTTVSTIGTSAKEGTIPTSTGSGTDVTYPSSLGTTGKDVTSSGTTGKDATISSSNSQESGEKKDVTAPSFTSPSASDTTGPSVAETSVTGVTAPSSLETTSSAESTTTGSTKPSFKISSSFRQLPTGSNKVEIAASENKDAVLDPSAAASEHDKKDDGGPKEYKKGGGKEYHEEHEAEHSEHGKKAYEGAHKDTKSAKGHHEKEDHHGKYDDYGNTDKRHHDESGHYGIHHHEEAGKKHAKYEESGKHSKGHSTKGSHDVHKKEEYEKKVEFFEEEGDSGEEEKKGGFHEDKGHGKGGSFKEGDLEADHEHQQHGKGGHFAKGGSGNTLKGYKSSAGADSYGKHGREHLSKGGKESGKKWIYHHGYPPQNANLVVIDRRGDHWQHGPQFYG